MQENMDYKKHGDAAFLAKDFDTAIEFYTEVKNVIDTLCNSTSSRSINKRT